MATKQEQAFRMRLLVDKERNHVVMAEASGEFIDTLFSFLTLPLGTIIRLVSKNDQQPQGIGCINNLYHCVQGSPNEIFWNQVCKKMLLCPRNPSESLCKKLSLNVDDTEPIRYFMCGFCDKQSNPLLSTFAGASCSSCGRLMDKEIKQIFGDSCEENTNLEGNGAFVKRDAMYLVFDDLKVLQSSPNNFVKELVQLGYKNFNNLTEMLPNVGLKEILDLLRQSLTSKSALSDVFLGNDESKGMHIPLLKVGLGFEPRTYHSNINNPTINLKVTVRKSKMKILYAESEGNFVDFLFSFLTAPLGSILKLLDGNSSLGCIDNLYKSVKELNSSWFINPPQTTLLDPEVAPQFGLNRMVQPLVKLYEGQSPSYYYARSVIKNNVCYDYGDGVISKGYNSLLQNPCAMRIFDPRSSRGIKEFAVGFVKRPSMFVVWDDLQVTPLANTSSISIMQKMNVPLDDLEEHVVRIREEEALNLLGASLTSKAALTEGLFYLLKKPKEDVKA